MTSGSVSPPPAYLARLSSAVLAGGLLFALGSACAGFLLVALRQPAAAGALRGFLAAGGWLWLPLWGGAAGALASLRSATTLARRAGTLALAVALAALPLIARPIVSEPSGGERPRGARAKSLAILRWSYRSPATVARILELSHDPDPMVREQAVLALGVNLIVTDIEHATAGRPARYADHPLRARLRARLRAALADPVEAVRAEAARALWKAPRAFGRDTAAAETLAALLDRASRGGAAGRPAWLALDAAAGEPNAKLIAAAARFGAATPDTALKRAARLAARPRTPR